MLSFACVCCPRLSYQCSHLKVLTLWLFYKNSDSDDLKSGIQILLFLFWKASINQLVVEGKTVKKKSV
jgi:hypothetical protein